MSTIEEDQCQPQKEQSQQDLESIGNRWHIEKASTLGNCLPHLTSVPTVICGFVGTTVSNDQFLLGFAFPYLTWRESTLVDKLSDYQIYFREINQRCPFEKELIFRNKKNTLWKDITNLFHCYIPQPAKISNCIFNYNF